MSADGYFTREPSPYPIREGNLIRPLVDGEPAFQRICAAVDAARRSVWVTVAFMWPEFLMPDGRTALELLDQAAGRGVDVRVIFWRPDDETGRHRRNAFWGSEAHFEALRSLQGGIKMRWDRAAAGFCQHQKSWLIDAGEPDATAFIGGINLNPNSVVSPGHGGVGENHDVYAEVKGPVTFDVHHNFAQRWNEASERETSDGLWGAGSDTNLSYPETVPPPCGPASAQIQRTNHAGRFADAESFAFSAGERTILAQYCAAIDAAREAIYLENQYIEDQEIVEALARALRRDVQVVWLAPALPDLLPNAYEAPDRQSFFDFRSALGALAGFTLAGIAGQGADGRRNPVYVHAKLMLVDDRWATVGSCNLHRYSLFGNSEMNVALEDPEAVRALRVSLFEEHLAEDTAGLDARAALAVFREVALENRRRLTLGDPAWRGLAFALDIAAYGKIRQI